MLNLIGREAPFFNSDLECKSSEIKKIVSGSSFLILGGAGSIGQAVTKEIFQRNPKKLHVVDLSENNLVELVRDIRSSFGYINGEFKTFALDIGSVEFDAFVKSDGKYDFVLNLSALKHVRSEKDPFTLMRMIEVNIFNTIKTLEQSIQNGVKKYFCVSTDKAANPVNMMGASKRIMEMFLMQYGKQIDISTARFANVAFSDGSLLHGFDKRIEKKQPIVAPSDVRRYFVTPQESGELCLMSCLFGDNRDIFFPKLSEDLHLTTFSDIAIKYIKQKGFEAYICKNEDEARGLSEILPSKGLWPCFFTKSDTTGEKDFEEFYTENEQLDLLRFNSIGIVKNNSPFSNELLGMFSKEIKSMKSGPGWKKQEIVALFHKMIPDFQHKETGKYLDSKM